MQNSPITVVLSQGQSRNPEKRALEEAVANQAALLPNVTVVIIPNLYDLQPHGESIVRLKQVVGPIVILSWLYERAAHWIFDRVGIRGQMGEVQLTSMEDEDERESESAQDDADKVTNIHPRPNRPIYCLDLRASESASAFLDELRRIQQETNQANAMKLASPTNNTALVMDGSGRLEIHQPTITITPAIFGMGAINTIDEHPGRRWYPVIDFSRCTNCMECIDFCLFGVYGVDSVETILVEQPDNCRKGCPACSRVCPSNAIMFPQHKTPAIAGAPVDVGGLKIDLSKLFGAPDRDEDPIAAAARERDEQLILAGRHAVGTSVGIRSQTIERDKSAPKDEFDNLLDQLDLLNL